MTITNETPTSCIVHLADNANLKGSAFNKLYNSLTGSCFESPNDTIHARRYRQCRVTQYDIAERTKL
jgi:hypothetical protein